MKQNFFYDCQKILLEHENLLKRIHGKIINFRDQNSGQWLTEWNQFPFMNVKNSLKLQKVKKKYIEQNLVYWGTRLKSNLFYKCEKLLNIA